MNDAWEPIETAPKDGTKVDLWHPTKGRLENAFYQAQTYSPDVPWGWSNPWWGRITGATHWMPLPLPPSPANSSGDRNNG